MSINKTITIKAIPTKSDVLGIKGQGFTRFPGTKRFLRALDDKKLGRRTTGESYWGDTKEDIQIKREYFEKAFGENLGSESTFWDGFKIILDEGDNILNIKDNVKHELQYFMMKELSVIANSLKEWREGKWPNAEFYIEDPDTEAEEKEAVYNFKQEAFVLMSTLTPEAKRTIARVIGISVKSNSEAHINNMLFDNIEANAKKFLEIAKRPKVQLYTESLIKDALDCGVIRIKENRYYRGSPDDGFEIGYDYYTALEFLMTKKNQDIKNQIEKEIEGRKGRIAIEPAKI